jgi:hypothetical protein
VLQSKTAAWAYLCLVAYWKGDAEPGRDEFALKRMKGYRFLDVCTKIHTCTLWSGVLRKWLRAGVDDFDL